MVSLEREYVELNFSQGPKFVNTKKLILTKFVGLRYFNDPENLQTLDP